MDEQSFGTEVADPMPNAADSMDLCGDQEIELQQLVDFLGEEHFFFSRLLIVFYFNANSWLAAQIASQPHLPCFPLSVY